MGGSEETHVIAEIDKANHIADASCPCEPCLRVDAETGAMIWVHKVTTEVFSDFINL